MDKEDKIKDGVITYNGVTYKVKDGQVLWKPGIMRPWKPLPKKQSDMIIRKVKKLKEDPKTKVYG